MLHVAIQHVMFHNSFVNFETKNPHQQWNNTHMPQILLGTSPSIFNVKICEKKTLN